MAVFKVNKKRDHTKVNMFLDGNVDLQRFDVLKYKQFDKLTDKPNMQTYTIKSSK